MLTPFEEVMKNWERMCNTLHKQGKCLPTKYDGCPLYDGESCGAIYNRRSKEIDYSEVEQIVQNWVKSNPEPKYPDWIEWFNEMGLVHSQSDYFTDRIILNVTSKAYEPIPAEIAEKLGVKPK